MRLTSMTCVPLATAFALAASFGFPSPPAYAAQPANQVTGVTSISDGAATTITIAGTATPTFTVYKLDRPSRLVIDVASATLAKRLDTRGENKATFALNTWAVQRVVASARRDNKNKLVRVVVSLARASSYRVKAVGNNLVIRVSAREPAPANPTAASVKANADARSRSEASARLANARAAQAERSAERNRASRADAEARLKRALAETEAAKARADKATREAKEVKEQARAESAAAAARLASAEGRITQAQKDGVRAQKLLAAAERARAEAKEAARKASLREKSAKTALANAKSQRKVADAAEKSAARYREEADRAKATGSSESSRLAARAQKAAAAADAKRNEAEKATRVAEQRRREAEAAEASARKRTRETTEALAAAERRRKSAENARIAAENARAKATKENRVLLADIDRAKASAKLAASEAKNFKKAAALAKRQAAEARASRVAEEKALAKAERGRLLAERRADEARGAIGKKERSLAALKKAERRTRTRRAAADAAQVRANTGKATLDEARARKRELAAAEKELTARRREVATAQENVTTLERSRRSAQGELASLKRSAEKAVATRKREEARAKQADQRRREADGALATAHQQLAAARADRQRAASELKAARAERRQAATKRAAADKSIAARAKRQNLAAMPKGIVRVNDVKFVDKGNAARVVVGLSAPAKPRVIRNRGKLAVLEIEGVAMAKDLERTLDTSAFGGPIKAVSSYVDPKRANTVRVVVDLHEPTQAVLKKVGNTYYWDFPNARQTAGRVAKSASKTNRGGRTRVLPSPSVASASFAGPSTSVTQQTVAQVRKRRRVYRGRRIDLNFKDADIHNLLRILATVGGVNIVVPQSVTGTVTVRLKSVPWDQAMEVILSSQGLWYRRSGSLIRVAKRDVLEKEDEEAAKRRAAAIKSEAPEPELFTLNYAEAGEIRNQLAPLLSPKGQIQVDARTNSLIVNDIAAHRRRIIDLATRLDTQTPQIQIEARIVEARTTFVREFGIQWGGNAAASPQGGNPTGLVFPNSVAVGGAAGQEAGQGLAAPTDFAVNLPAAIGLGSGGGLGLSLGSVGGNFNIGLRLSALEDSGSARIISSPKITTSNNIQARIRSGVSIPISVVSANGTQTQFVPADLALEVTPKVSQRDCSVSMVVNVTKNEADFANTGARGDPSILTKEANTTILVADGETAVIGGIYTRNTGLNYSKVPFFADIPVIGYFFKNRRENDERSEVLVFITPKITNRAFLRCE